MRKLLFAISAIGVFLVWFLALAEAQNITTLAGGGPTGIASTMAGLGTPWGVVQDAHGNTYISDNLSNRVFKVDANGTVTVAAGNIVNNYNQANHGDGQLANTAPLNAPEGIALDSRGLLYIADTNNNAIRLVNTTSTPQTVAGVSVPAGVIETVAGDGNGSSGYGGDGAAATSATLNAPSAIWLDGDDNLYILDSGNSAVRVVNMTASAISFPGSRANNPVAPGNIDTVVGTGVAGFADGALATAQFNFPLGIYVTGKASNNTVVIVVADTINNRIRAVNTAASGSVAVAGVSVNAGNVATVAGDGTQGYSGDNNPALGAKLNHPSAVVLDNAGNLYIADGDNEPPPQTPPTSNEVIRKVNTSNTITTFAGTGGVPCSNGILPCGDGKAATGANLWAPTGVFVTGTGSVLIADQNDDVIREVSGGNIQTLMGILLDTSYTPFPVTLTSAATKAEMRRPAGVAADAAGNVYIADTFNNAIRKVDLNGTMSTVVGSGLPCNTATCGDGGPASSGTVTTPFDIAFDHAGNLYIADSGDNVIRVVNMQSTSVTIAGQLIGAGDILTVAGNGAPCTASPCGDGNPATSAELNSPQGLAVDSAGNILVADTGDNAIRSIGTTGTISTVAGAADPINGCTDPTTPCGDNGPATGALLNAPAGVAVDAQNNIFIADTADNRVRKVDHASGVINAFAGTGVACTLNCNNGKDATMALLDEPQDVFVDFAGNVFIADTFDFEVREVTVADLKIKGVAGNETRGFSGDGGVATSAQLALPFGVAGDPSGNLLIADLVEWRVRKVAGAVATPPAAQLSKTSVEFPAQALNTKSTAIPVTLSNAGNLSNLIVSGITISGANKSDFAQTNNCTTIAGGASCTVNITITPSASGARSAVVSIADNAAGSPHTINLSGTGEDFVLPNTGALNNPSVTAGGSATATITITPGGGLAAAVALTCAVTPATANPPTCALSPTSLPPGTTKSTLTVTTVAASAALVEPGVVHRSSPMYAIWLLLPGMLLSTAGVGASRRRKLASYFLIFCALAGCLFLVACGGGGASGGGGGGGTGGTTPGAYTVTVTAKTSATTATQTLPLTVQ
ncbi:MAG: choice-of-anchor D domain-containing protein [Terriglobales bacterium]